MPVNILTKVLILLTSIQVTHGQTCKDSPLVFKLKIPGESNRARTCASVIQDNSLCALGGAVSGRVESHCPATCGVEDCSNIESEMRFQVLLEKNNNLEIRWKNCDWLGVKNTCNRCKKEGMADTCPLTCANCLEDLSAAPSEVATTVPSSAPSTVSSSAPSITPIDNIIDSNNCDDSPFTFKIRGRKLNCFKVKKKSLCDFGTEKSGIASSHCPKTCGKTDCTNIESEVRFEVNLVRKINGQATNVTKWKKCSWMNVNNNKHCAKRCKKDGIRTTCPLTCSQCPTDR